MKFPLIRIREKGSNDKGYFLGLDEAHHMLILDSNGNLKFHNIQCCDGTGKHGSFEFVTTKGYWGDEIEFGNIWDILNIYKEHLQIQEFQLDEEFNKALQQLKIVSDKAISLKEKEYDEMVQNLFEEINKEKTEEEIKAEKFMKKVEEKRKSIYMSIPEFAKKLGLTATQYCDIRAGRKSLNTEIKKDIENLLEQEGV